MDSSNKKSNVHSHNLRGIKMIDGEFYVPLFQIVKFCKRFALYKAKDLAVVIEQALNELKTNKVKQKDIPILSTKKSFLGRMFD